ncbi:MAG: RsiV family protein [Clostridiales bacterium]|jgi:hypothetical protein|nr:RsiV family protein [Clostridiales bacterium]
MDSLEKAINEYKSIEIPKEELEARVRGAIKKARAIRAKAAPVWAARGAAAASGLIITLNAAPSVAMAAAEAPGLRGVVNALTFNRFNLTDGKRRAEVSLETPQIAEGAAPEAIVSSLNAKYLKEQREAYEKFIADAGLDKPDSDEIINRSLSAGAEVVKNDGGLLVIKHWTLETAGSSLETRRFDNIDVENGVILSLPALFKDDGYIGAINAEISRQMAEQEASGEKTYFHDDGYFGEFFETISPDAKFYINSGNKLVIVFDKYEIAPGSAGLPEFIIPTDVISSHLAGDLYIN